MFIFVSYVPWYTNEKHISLFKYLFKIFIFVRYVPWYTIKKVCGRRTPHFNVFGSHVDLLCSPPPPP